MNEGRGIRMYCKNNILIRILELYVIWNFCFIFILLKRILFINWVFLIKLIFSLTKIIFNIIIKNLIKGLDSKLTTHN